MALIDELKQQKAEIAERLERAVNDVQYFDGRMADLLLAIAALEPTPAELFAEEKETAREQLEREPEIEAAPADEQDDASEFAADDDAPAEHISILTGDPAIEPESGLHGDNPVVIKPYRVTRDFDYKKTVEFFVTAEEATAYYNDLLDKPNHGVWLSVLRDGVWLSVAALDEAPALNEAMQDEREQPYRIIANVDDKPVTIDFAMFHDATECMEELKLRSTSKAELSVLHEGENGEQDRVTLSSFVEAEPQPDGYAPVTNPEAHIQAVEAERYALATNPEADALARARDWYDPKAVADRNRFNPWGGVSNLFGKPKVDA